MATGADGWCYTHSIAWSPLISAFARWDRQQDRLLAEAGYIQAEIAANRRKWINPPKYESGKKVAKDSSINSSTEYI